MLLLEKAAKGESILVGLESDAAFGLLGRRLEQLADGFKDDAELFVILHLHRFDLAVEVGDIEAHLTQPDKGPDHLHAGGNRSGAVEDIGGHKRAMLGKDIGRIAAAAPALF